MQVDQLEIVVGQAEQLDPWVPFAVAICAAAATALFIFGCGWYARYRRSRFQRKGLAGTFLADAALLTGRYDAIIRKALLAEIGPDRIPSFQLVEPGHNFFAVFDGKVRDLDILDVELQACIVNFYTNAKAFYDEALYYSRKLDELEELRAKLGFKITRGPGEQLAALTPQQIEAQITTISSVYPDAATDLRSRANTNMLLSQRLFSILQAHYQYLLERDKEVLQLYKDMKAKLEAEQEKLA